MDPIEMLSAEHALIRRQLALLAEASNRVQRARSVPMAFFEKCARFARDFSDGYHHFKEEHILFLFLAQKTDEAVQAELDHLRRQWEQSQRIMSDVVDLAEGYLSDEGSHRMKLLESLASYGSLIDQHLRTEDDVIFPLVRQTLSPEEMDEMRERFNAERYHAGWNVFECFQRLVDEMSLELPPE